MCISFFFFNDTATTKIYTLSLHDALPICTSSRVTSVQMLPPMSLLPRLGTTTGTDCSEASASNCRSEEHTSELQSPCNLVCRLLLEKKKTKLVRDRLVRYDMLASIAPADP